MFEVFFVAVVLKHVLWVVFPKPLGFVDVKGAGLDFHLLALSAARDRSRQTWKKSEKEVVQSHGLGNSFQNLASVQHLRARTVCGDEARQSLRLTQVILQLLGASVLRRGDQVPHEAFDFVIPTVMDEAVRQQGSANGLHVPLCQLFLKTPVVENILPTTPPGKRERQRVKRGGLRLKSLGTLYYCVFTMIVVLLMSL